MTRRRGTVLAAIMAGLVILAAAGFFLVNAAENRVTADMLFRADRVAIPSGWRLTQETVRPERFLCISTNPCPSLHRRWDTGKELTDGDVTALTSQMGFEMTTDRPCTRPADGIGVITLCSSTGTDGEYSYLITVTSPGPQEPQLVTLIVRPAS